MTVYTKPAPRFQSALRTSPERRWRFLAARWPSVFQSALRTGARRDPVPSAARLRARGFNPLSGPEPGETRVEKQNGARGILFQSALRTGARRDLTPAAGYRLHRRFQSALRTGARRDLGASVRRCFHATQRVSNRSPDRSPERPAHCGRSWWSSDDRFNPLSGPEPGETGRRLENKSAAAPFLKGFNPLSGPEPGETSGRHGLFCMGIEFQSALRTGARRDAGATSATAVAYG